MSFVSLPLEVISEIFSFLNEAAMGRIQTISHEFRRDLNNHWVDRVVALANLDMTAGMPKVEVVIKLNHIVRAETIFIEALKRILAGCSLAEVVAIYKYPNYPHPNLVKSALREHLAEQTVEYCYELFFLTLD